MLKRGGLAKAGASHSYSHCGVEEAALNALRKAVPAGYLSDATGVFLHIIGSENVSEVDVTSALDLVSGKINQGVNILCARRVKANLQGSTFVSLLATGIPFPYTWGGYRKLPIEIFEMEPEAGEEEQVTLNFGLDQIEAISV
jgi:cell division GTPase FtsZ